MLTNAFCLQHRLFVSQEQSGQCCLNYLPPLMPWVYLYAARLLPRPLNVREIKSDEFDAWLAQNALKDNACAETVDNMLSEQTFSGLLEALPQGGIESLEDSEAPVIRLVNTMLQEARTAGASDIHIETFQHHFQVRYRIDGVMREISRGDSRLGAPLISRLKIMARLDIAERRLPQDGRFIHSDGDREIDVRLSIIPVNHGERAVMRLLDQCQLPGDFSSLGMPETMAKYLRHVIARPHGIVLVTGPTGSGKSSTLYTCLQQLNQSNRTLLTIEDPVEYKLPGVGQTQVNSRINLDFARGLRAILRQDPDVVMIGEIRDTETAKVAVQASLTGHLVFSTLHTNSAAGAVARLCDMGVEPWLLASSLSALVAQRLVRKLCPHCREARPVNQQERRWLQLDEDEVPTTVIYHPVGCEQCNQQGYAGRVGIFELILLNTALRELIQQRASTEELTRCARRSLAGIDDDARRKVLAGITSFAEATRVIEDREEKV
ncbi:MAG: GspE/PulE family protein [Kluyvera sp.]|uniref:GspE/PulE family protein n=1 Tax=Kluyvera sp. TaxID=1538228 RepID=UPI003F2D946A